MDRCGCLARSDGPVSRPLREKAMAPARAAHGGLNSCFTVLTGLPGPIHHCRSVPCRNGMHGATSTEIRITTGWSSYRIRSSMNGCGGDDHLYDIVGVLSYNRVPRIQGAGSAIFLHSARPGYQPTAGCVALAFPDLVRLLEYRPGLEAIAFV